MGRGIEIINGSRLQSQHLTASCRPKRHKIGLRKLLAHPRGIGRSGWRHEGEHRDDSGELHPARTVGGRQQILHVASDMRVAAGFMWTA